MGFIWPPQDVVMAMAAEPAMVTVPHVPIVSVGTYNLGLNAFGDDKTTFTFEDLVDAAAAPNDPHIPTPRLKLGHLSDWGDAEPAFGKVTNMHADSEDMTLYGDFTGTPAWLAKVLPSVYPGRSIEAHFGVKTPSGSEYRMVISAVALLGVVMPGVSTLEDLAGMYSDTMPEGVEIEAQSHVTAALGKEQDVGLFSRSKAEAAATNVEDVRRAYYDEHGMADMSWIREMYFDENFLIIDDGDGELYRLPFTADGEEVEFGEAEKVRVEYVTAAGKPSAQPLVANAGQVVYASRSESRPETTAKEDQVDGARLRTMLGLPEEASDDDVEAALKRAAETTPPDPEEETTDEGAEEEGEDEESETTEPEAEKKPVAASAGTVTMDSDALRELQANAAKGAQAHAERELEKRDTTIAAALKDGKIPRASKEKYEQLWANDAKGTAELLASLAPGVVPVEEQGTVPGESEAEDSAYDPSWLSSTERARAAGQVPSGAGSVTREEK